MRYLLLAAAFACLWGASEASAQIVVGRPVVAYYAPTVAVPVYQAPAYYAPYPVAQAAYYAPTVAAYPAPTVAYYAPTPAYYTAPVVVVGRPAWLGVNAYGGLQPYIVGRPVRNTFRYFYP